MFLLGVFAHSRRGYAVKHTHTHTHVQWATSPLRHTRTSSVSESEHTHMTFDTGLVRTAGFSVLIKTFYPSDVILGFANTGNQVHTDLSALVSVFAL